MQQQTATEQFARLPATVTSSEGKLVYLYLEATGGATVSDLNRTLAMNKLSVLSVLQSLSSEGLVERTDSEYVVAS